MSLTWDYWNLAGRPELPEGVGELASEASQEGFVFMDRLITEWRSGVNRFEEDDEAFFAVVLEGGRIIGAGGVNRDYAFPSGVARLRHVYVRQEARRYGVGSALVGRLERHADLNFSVIRLRTDTAARFYEKRGYRPVESATAAATHVLDLSNREWPSDAVSLVHQGREEREARLDRYV